MDNNIVEPIAPLSPLKARAQELRERAARLRGGAGGTLTLLPNAIATAMEVYANILETADNIMDAVNKFRATNEYKALNPQEKAEVDEIVAEDIETFKVEETKVKAKESGKEKQKAVELRIVEGTGTKRVKETAERIGLTYQVETHADAEAMADEFIQEVGLDAAIEAVRKNMIEGGAAAYVWVKCIDMVGQKLSTTKNQEEIEALEKLERELISDLSNKSRNDAGRFLSALGDAYAKSDLGYRLSTQVERYEQVTGEKIPDDVLERFKEYDQKLKEAKEKLAEYEKKEAERKENEAFENIKAETEQESKKTYTQRAKKAADNFRKLKSKPVMFYDENGNPIDIKKQGFDWNELVEIGAKAIEATGKVADGVSAMLKYVAEQDWYKNLTDKGRASVDSQVKQMFEDNDVVEGIKITRSEIREAIKGGAQNMTDLVAFFKEKYPDYDERAIRDAITGYGKTANPTKDELELKINELNRIGRLISKLDDLQRNGRKAKTPAEKKRISDEEQRLKDEIKKLNRTLPYSAEEIQKFEADSLERAKVRAAQKIEEFKQRIKDGDFSKAKKKSYIIEDKELNDLLIEKQKWQDAYDKEFYSAELKNRTRAEKISDAALEAWGITRALMATAEMSFVLIQGGIQTLAHPKNAARAFWKAIEHGFSEAKAEKWGQFVKSQPYYRIMKGSKLSLSEYDAKLDAREEVYLGGWVNNIWDFAGLPIKMFSKNAYSTWKKVNLFKAVERAGVAYLNTLRILRFLDGMETLESHGKTFRDNPDDYRNVADVINTMTGRASLGKFEDSPTLKKALPFLFFSPRNWASTIKTVTPYAFIYLGKKGYKDGSYKPSAAQKIAVSDFMRYVAVTGSAVLALAAMYNDDEESDIKVELDPRSSDFLKIRKGNTRIDPWGGRVQMVTYMSRLFMDMMGKEAYKSTSTGNLSYLGQGMTPNQLEITLRMFENKLSPSLGLLVEYAKTEYDPNTQKRVNKMEGDEYDFTTALAGRLYPMYWSTINELYKDQPSTLTRFALTSYAFFGGGVSTYEGKFKTKLPLQKYFDGLSKPSIKNDLISLDNIGIETRQMTETEFEQYRTNVEAKFGKLLDKYIEAGMVENPPVLGDSPDEQELALQSVKQYNKANPENTIKSFTGASNEQRKELEDIFKKLALDKVSKSNVTKLYTLSKNAALSKAIEDAKGTLTIKDKKAIMDYENTERAIDQQITLSKK